MAEKRDKLRNPTKRKFLRLFLLSVFGATLLPQRILFAQHRSDIMTDSPLKLFLCGDVMTGRGIDQILPHPVNAKLHEPFITDARDYVTLAERANGPIPKPVDFAYIWGDALTELERLAPDLRIINLETAVTDSDNYLAKGINYRMHPDNVQCLASANIDCCLLANNHVLDWGSEGLSDTLETLSMADLYHTGAGHTLAQAQLPAILGVPGKTSVAVYSFGDKSSGIDPSWRATTERPGVNFLPNLSDVTVRTIADQVEQVKQTGKVNIVIASIHWGGNWGYKIDDEQRQFAHALIDSAGVDIVHGHSSHHVKGIEVYKNRPIIYGCGDFLNDYEGISGYEEYRGDLGLMYFPILDSTSGKLLQLEMTPTRIKNLRVNIATPTEAQWLVETLNRESKALGTWVTLNKENRLQLHWQRKKSKETLSQFA